MAMIETNSVCYRMGMIRLLPIILLALGLVLTFSSLTRAETPSSAARSDGFACLEEVRTETALREPARNGVICWKKIRTGLLVIPCPPDPSLVVFPVTLTPPAPDYPGLQAVAPIASDIEPILLLPPPRA